MNLIITQGVTLFFYISHQGFTLSFYMLHFLRCEYRI